MGMYDSILVPCPACSEEHEFQSKGGLCEMRTFKLEDRDIPADVLSDVNRHSPKTCFKCNQAFEVGVVDGEHVPVKLIQRPDQNCPQCGKTGPWEREVDDNFHYADGNDSVLLPSKAPVMRCDGCGFQYMDHRVEDIHMRVVQDYRTGKIQPIPEDKEFLVLTVWDNPNEGIDFHVGYKDEFEKQVAFDGRKPRILKRFWIRGKIVKEAFGEPTPIPG